VLVAYAWRFLERVHDELVGRFLVNHGSR
jgi:hypothetical protein